MRSSSIILSTLVCGSLSYAEAKAQLGGYNTPSPAEPCFLIQDSFCCSRKLLCIKTG